ncbi:MAG: DUF4375 domain-containing protein [Clostridiales bacterium]|nr:DUF4375 domain-containing protein [Clostridiales bacterium]
MGFFKRKKDDGTIGHLTMREIKEKYPILIPEKIDDDVEIDMTFSDLELDMTFSKWKKMKQKEFPRKLKNKIIYMTVDGRLINSNDIRYIQTAIQPLWWYVSIYDGEEQYEQDFKPFSIPQRYVFAIQWYSIEVGNRGHAQFYDNPTGIVWEDALKGFEAIGARRNVDVIKETIARIGENPSKDREKRQKQIEKRNAEFDDLDRLFGESKETMYELLDVYVKANAKDFYFSGILAMPEENIELFSRLHTGIISHV